MPQAKIVLLSMIFGALVVAATTYGTMAFYTASKSTSSWTVSKECQSKTVCVPGVDYEVKVDRVPEKLGTPMNVAPLFSYYLEEGENPGWGGKLALVFNFIFWTGLALIALEIIRFFLSAKAAFDAENSIN